MKPALVIDIEWAKRHLRGFDHSLVAVSRVKISQKAYQQFKREVEHADKK